MEQIKTTGMTNEMEKMALMARMGEDSAECVEGTDGGDMVMTALIMKMEQTETMVRTEQMVKTEQMAKMGKTALMSVQMS